jgi:hypothetical protein
MEGNGDIDSHDDENLFAAGVELEDLVSSDEEIPDRMSFFIDFVVPACPHCPIRSGTFHFQCNILLQAVDALVKADTIICVVYIGKQHFPADSLVINQQYHQDSPMGISGLLLVTA